MRLSGDQCRDRVEKARVARLATAGADRAPHLVPVTFAIRAEVLVVVVDHKPKTTTRLRRLRNVRENAAVAFLVDEYDDDWDRLWWVRVDARAEVLTAGPRWSEAVDWLAERYTQYRVRPPTGPVIWSTAVAWSGWSAT